MPYGGAGLNLWLTDVRREGPGDDRQRQHESELESASRWCTGMFGRTLGNVVVGPQFAVPELRHRDLGR